MRPNTLLLAVFLFMGCNTFTRRIVEEQHGWIGPANSAFEDYMYYYYDLPHSLKELSDFIKVRDSELQNEQYCFGNVGTLCHEFKYRKYAYLNMGDSCFFYTKKYNGIRETCKMYSPLFCFEEPDRTEGFRLKPIIQQYGPAFFDDKGKRCSFGLEDSFIDGLNLLSEKYRKLLVKKYDREMTWFHYNFLFSYENGKLKLMESDFPQKSLYVYQISEDGTELQKDIVIDCRYLDSVWIAELEEYLDVFFQSHNGIERIVFPSRLFI